MLCSGWGPSAPRVAQLQAWQRLAAGAYPPLTPTLHPGDAVAAAKAEGADVIVLLTHLGLKADKELAAAPWASEADIIVGEPQAAAQAGGGGAGQPWLT